VHERSAAEKVNKLQESLEERKQQFANVLAK
jgi:hypothetical protein